MGRAFLWVKLPEWNVAIFSFLLNFVWEIQQMPFFQIPLDFSCSDIIRNCTLATIGDVGISTTAFWMVAVISKSRQWVNQSSRLQISVFVLVGVAITISFEALATGPLNLWEYAALMPKLPLLGTGLLPLFQWLLIPPLIVWFVQRQLFYTRHK
ncbi:hypothetical protein B1A85_15895 [Chroococcidiopsis sp. TS-821]|nr:hypothetical protein B1A85_15895 [Chroococcidiopsis sp. TS-821]